MKLIKWGKCCRGGHESSAFLQRVTPAQVWAVTATLSSPDAIFTGSTKCFSITPVVIEREMNVSERS